jgi:hypothetical protein
MSNGRNKYQARESRAKIREVLLESWDPCGVRDSPQAHDEYDAYIGKIYVMLMNENATQQSIAAYLWEVATNYMGLSPSPWLKEHGDHAAELIEGLRSGFLTH